MMKFKSFVTDCISTFLFFVYEGLIIASYFITEAINVFVKFIKGFIIPSLIDLLSDLSYLIHVIVYEFLYHSSVLSLKLSQLLSSLSKYLLTKAEENSNKKAW